MTTTAESTVHVNDEENPPAISAPSRKWLIFKDPDPAFTQTAIAIGTNIVLTNMFLYGITGNARIAYLASMATIPASVILSIRDAKIDYEKWKEQRHLRAKGVPERFMHYKCKNDWTDYEKHVLSTSQESSA